ncbi:hypothetical protein NEUTE2DRAFT_74460, partial [Neurospora tetrasperma FGSC 2509]
QMLNQIDQAKRVALCCLFHLLPYPIQHANQFATNFLFGMLGDLGLGSSVSPAVLDKETKKTER